MGAGGLLRSEHSTGLESSEELMPRGHTLAKDFALYLEGYGKPSEGLRRRLTYLFRTNTWYLSLEHAQKRSEIPGGMLV